MSAPHGTPKVMGVGGAKLLTGLALAAVVVLAAGLIVVPRVLLPASDTAALPTSEGSPVSSASLETATSEATEASPSPTLAETPTPSPTPTPTPIPTPKPTVGGVLTIVKVYSPSQPDGRTMSVNIDYTFSGPMPKKAEPLLYSVLGCDVTGWVISGGDPIQVGTHTVEGWVMATRVGSAETTCTTFKVTANPETGYHWTVKGKTTWAITSHFAP